MDRDNRSEQRRHCCVVIEHHSRLMKLYNAFYVYSFLYVFVNIFFSGACHWSDSEEDITPRTHRTLLLDDTTCQNLAQIDPKGLLLLLNLKPYIIHANIHCPIFNPSPDFHEPLPILLLRQKNPNLIALLEKIFLLGYQIERKDSQGHSILYYILKKQHSKLLHKLIEWRKQEVSHEFKELYPIFIPLLTEWGTLDDVRILFTEQVVNASMLEKIFVNEKAKWEGKLGNIPWINILSTLDNNATTSRNKENNKNPFPTFSDNSDNREDPNHSSLTTWMLRMRNHHINGSLERMFFFAKHFAEHVIDSKSDLRGIFETEKVRQASLEENFSPGDTTSQSEERADTQRPEILNTLDQMKILLLDTAEDGLKSASRSLMDKNYFTDKEISLLNYYHEFRMQKRRKVFHASTASALTLIATSEEWNIYISPKVSAPKEKRRLWVIVREYLLEKHCTIQHPCSFEEGMILAKELSSTNLLIPPSVSPLVAQDQFHIIPEVYGEVLRQDAALDKKKEITEAGACITEFVEDQLSSCENEIFISALIVALAALPSPSQELSGIGELRSQESLTAKWNLFNKSLFSFIKGLGRQKTVEKKARVDKTLIDKQDQMSMEELLELLEDDYSSKKTLVSTEDFIGISSVFQHLSSEEKQFVRDTLLSIRSYLQSDNMVYIPLFVGSKSINDDDEKPIHIYFYPGEINLCGSSLHEYNFSYIEMKMEGIEDPNDTVPNTFFSLQQPKNILYRAYINASLFPRVKKVSPFSLLSPPPNRLTPTLTVPSPAKTVFTCSPSNRIDEFLSSIKQQARRSDLETRGANPDQWVSADNDKPLQKFMETNLVTTSLPLLSTALFRFTNSHVAMKNIQFSHILTTSSLIEAKSSSVYLKACDFFHLHNLNPLTSLLSFSSMEDLHIVDSHFVRSSNGFLPSLKILERFFKHFYSSDIFFQRAMKDLQEGKQIPDLATALQLARKHKWDFDILFAPQEKEETEDQEEKVPGNDTKVKEAERTVKEGDNHANNLKKAQKHYNKALFGWTSLKSWKKGDSVTYFLQAVQHIRKWREQLLLNLRLPSEINPLNHDSMEFDSNLSVLANDGKEDTSLFVDYSFLSSRDLLVYCYMSQVTKGDRDIVFYTTMLQQEIMRDNKLRNYIEKFQALAVDTIGYERTLYPMMTSIGSETSESNYANSSFADAVPMQTGESLTREIQSNSIILVTILPQANTSFYRNLFVDLYVDGGSVIDIDGNMTHQEHNQRVRILFSENYFISNYLKSFQLKGGVVRLSMPKGSERLDENEEENEARVQIPTSQGVSDSIKRDSLERLEYTQAVLQKQNLIVEKMEFSPHLAVWNLAKYYIDQVMSFIEFSYEYDSGCLLLSFIDSAVENSSFHYYVNSFSKDLTASLESQQRLCDYFQLQSYTPVYYELQGDGEEVDHAAAQRSAKKEQEHQKLRDFKNIGEWLDTWHVMDKQSLIDFAFASSPDGFTLDNFIPSSDNSSPQKGIQPLDVNSIYNELLEHHSVFLVEGFSTNLNALSPPAKDTSLERILLEECLKHSFIMISKVSTVKTVECRELFLRRPYLLHLPLPHLLTLLAGEKTLAHTQVHGAAIALIRDSHFLGNFVIGDGGAIHIDNIYTKVQRSSIVANTSKHGNGGGVYVNNGAQNDVFFMSCYLRGNIGAGDSSNEIYVESAGKVSLTTTTVITDTESNSLALKLFSRLIGIMGYIFSRQAIPSSVIPTPHSEVLFFKGLFARQITDNGINDVNRGYNYKKEQHQNKEDASDSNRKKAEVGYDDAYKDRVAYEFFDDRIVKKEIEKKIAMENREFFSEVDAKKSEKEQAEETISDILEDYQSFFQLTSMREMHRSLEELRKGLIRQVGLKIHDLLESPCIRKSENAKTLVRDLFFNILLRLRYSDDYLKDFMEEWNEAVSISSVLIDKEIEMGNAVCEKDLVNTILLQMTNASFKRLLHWGNLENEKAHALIRLSEMPLYEEAEGFNELNPQNSQESLKPFTARSEQKKGRQRNGRRNSAKRPQRQRKREESPREKQRRIDSITLLKNFEDVISIPLPDREFIDVSYETSIYLRREKKSVVIKKSSSFDTNYSEISCPHGFLLEREVEHIGNLNTTQQRVDFLSLLPRIISQTAETYFFDSDTLPKLSSEEMISLTKGISENRGDASLYEDFNWVISLFPILNVNKAFLEILSLVRQSTQEASNKHPLEITQSDSPVNPGVKGNGSGFDDSVLLNQIPVEDSNRLAQSELLQSPPLGDLSLNAHPPEDNVLPNSDLPENDSEKPRAKKSLLRHVMGYVLNLIEKSIEGEKPKDIIYPDAVQVLEAIESIGSRSATTFMRSPTRIIHSRKTVPFHSYSINCSPVPTSYYSLARGSFISETSVHENGINELVKSKEQQDDYFSPIDLYYNSPRILKHMLGRQISGGEGFFLPCDNDQSICLGGRDIKARPNKHCVAGVIQMPDTYLPLDKIDKMTKKIVLSTVEGYVSDLATSTFLLRKYGKNWIYESILRNNTSRRHANEEMAKTLQNEGILDRFLFGDFIGSIPLEIVNSRVHTLQYQRRARGSVYPLMACHECTSSHCSNNLTPVIDDTEWTQYTLQEDTSPRQWNYVNLDQDFSVSLSSSGLFTDYTVKPLKRQRSASLPLLVQDRNMLKTGSLEPASSLLNDVDKKREALDSVLESITKIDGEIILLNQILLNHTPYCDNMRNGLLCHQCQQGYMPISGSNKCVGDCNLLSSWSIMAIYGILMTVISWKSEAGSTAIFRIVTFFFLNMKTMDFKINDITSFVIDAFSPANYSKSSQIAESWNDLTMTVQEKIMQATKGTRRSTPGTEAKKPSVINRLFEICPKNYMSPLEEYLSSVWKSLSFLIIAFLSMLGVTIYHLAAHKRYENRKREKYIPFNLAIPQVPIESTPRVPSMPDSPERDASSTIKGFLLPEKNECELSDTSWKPDDIAVSEKETDLSPLFLRGTKEELFYSNDYYPHDDYSYELERREFKEDNNIEFNSLENKIQISTSIHVWHQVTSAKSDWIFPILRVFIIAFLSLFHNSIDLLLKLFKCEKYLFHDSQARLSIHNLVEYIPALECDEPIIFTTRLILLPIVVLFLLVINYYATKSIENPYKHKITNCIVATLQVPFNKKSSHWETYISLVRITTCVLATFIENPKFKYILLMFLSLLYSVVLLLKKPYQKRHENLIDTICWISLFLGCVTQLSLLDDMNATVQIYVFGPIRVVNMAIISLTAVLPMIIFFCYYLFYITKDIIASMLHGYLYMRDIKLKNVTFLQKINAKFIKRLGNYLSRFMTDSYSPSNTQTIDPQNEIEKAYLKNYYDSNLVTMQQWENLHK